MISHFQLLERKGIINIILVHKMFYISFDSMVIVLSNILSIQYTLPIYRGQITAARLI